MSNNIGVAAIANRPLLNTTGIESKPAFEYDASDDYLEGAMVGSGGDHAFTSSIMAFDTSIDVVAYLYTYGDKDASRSYVGLKPNMEQMLGLDDGSSPYNEVGFDASLDNASQIYTRKHTGVDLGSSNNFLWLGGVEQTSGSTGGTLEAVLQTWIKTINST